MRLITFLLLLTIGVKAQETDTVLKRILALKNDTELVNETYKYGFSIRNKNPQLSFRYAKLSEKTALKSKSKKHLAKSYNLLGVLFYKKGNYNRALDYHKKALILRQECNDLLGIGHSQTNLGNVYEDLFLYQEAEAAYLQAIKAYTDSHHEERIVPCLLNIGVLHQHQKEYDLAIQNYQLANELTETNDYNTKAIYLTNMAQAYMENGMIEKGIAFNQDALKLRLIADNHVETADNYLNLGTAYISINELSKAIYFIDTAYSIASKNDYFELMFQAAEVYASFYSTAKDFEKAFYWQKKFISLKDSLLKLQLDEKKLFDFDEIEINEAKNSTDNKTNNSALAFLIITFLILIPFTLIRFKR